MSDVTLSLEALGAYLGATSSAPVAWLVGVGVLVVSRASAPKIAGALRVPAALLALALISLVVALLSPDALGLTQPFVHLSLLLTLLSLGRSFFLLVVDAVLDRRFATPMPRILRDIVQAVFFVVALFVFLRAMGVELGSLLTTSALLTAVIGLALQDTLGNVISGLAIQFQRVVEVGDWIQFSTESELIGQVIEINWRATNIMTVDHVEVVIPNSILAKTPVRNFTRPTPVSRRTVDVQCAYEISPAQVREAILDALRGTPAVLEEPPPQVVTHAFADSGISYQVRFYISDFARHSAIDSAARDRIWYALKRAAIPIPFPIRTLELRAQPDVHPKGDDPLARTVAALRGVDFLRQLPEDSLRELARVTRTQLFATDEVIIRQGDRGSEFYILQRGEVSVLAGRDGGSVAEVAKLGPGAFFGEMSLMLGEARRATIRATRECEVFVLDKRALHPTLSAHPELLERIGSVLALRLEDLGSNLAERARRAASRKSDPEQTQDFMKRVREFFAL